ncbi:MAG TPA: phosphatidylserine/phosphatidylglycerophosphate/cardiolipin synthase family protein [Solirubrobacteraceae bacterium]|nr:phosphatidylserine/phosphatidylglycerophosphate/cardiolipin synthase family protein [Solirubrobacteraceae bacterium]
MPGAQAITHADRVVGRVIEGAMAAHHRRRLRNLGQIARYAPPEDGRLWAAGDPPPRPGNDVRVLIDGAQALPEMERAIRAARRHVHIAGWSITPHFALTRDEPPVVLREVLAEKAEAVDVRVLMWAGAPPRTFAPDRRAVRAGRDELVRGTRIRVALDARSRALHCHHEKLVIVDDEVAFVGGIDLTLLGGDRYDTNRHPARGRLGWHDAAARLRGPAVADVAAHFAGRWSEVTGEPLPASPAAARAGDVEVQVVRTVPERQYAFAPHGDFRLLEALLRGLRSARRFVHLESQFLWAPEVVDLLAAKLRDPPADDFRAVIVLPSKANNGQEDTRGQLAVLADADRDAHRLLAATIAARTGRTFDRMYVHAKIAVVDDCWMTIGSANLNAHSLFNDTEMNLVICDAALARDTRLRLWAEHLERDVVDVAGDPAAVVDELWRPIARDQLDRDRRGEARTHHLIELPPASRRLERLLGPVDALVVDG